MCTRGYTVVYTRVYSSLLGRRYSLGISTPRTRILLSSAYTPPRPYPRAMVISCVGPGEPRPLPDRPLILTHPLTLRTGLPLVHQATSLNSLCIPISRGALEDIPRRGDRTYNERLHHLCKVMEALIPRAHLRSRYERFRPLGRPDT